MAEEKVVKINVMNVPELVWRLRREMGNMLRMEAGKESNPKFAKRLRELAASFDIGATGPDGARMREK